MRVHQQRAYVLLNRPYSESSWVVEVFSREHGRLALMAKGARRVKSKLKGVLMPFQPLLISWSGKGEIPTLTSSEIDQSNFNLIEHELRADNLVCGFYCNELVVNLLHRYDPHTQLFDHYHQTVLGLADTTGTDNASILREFERVVMKETGYEINFEKEADGKTPIDENAFYYYQHGAGFVRVNVPQPTSVVGHVVKSFTAQRRQNLTAGEIIQGKQLMRDILRHALGRRRIVSRDLFFPKARNTENSYQR